MKIARYWARAERTARQPDGKSRCVSCWRWSEISQAEAQQRAEAAIQDAAARMAAGTSWGEGYAYLDRPPREEILQEIKENGQTVATVTRNGYGSLILNTRDLMFIDIDLPVEPLGATLMRSIGRLFGRDKNSPADETRARIAKIAHRHHRDTFRLYETSAGYRCALISRPILPGTSESNRLLTDFESDPLYVRLCQSQESYRVRLTPKFWRCGAPRPPHRYPWKNAEQEKRYREWEKEYGQQCNKYATCRFIEQVGRAPAIPGHERLVEMHDEMTKAHASAVSGLA